MVLLNFECDDKIDCVGQLTSFWLNGILLVVRYNRKNTRYGYGASYRLDSSHGSLANLYGYLYHISFLRFCQWDFPIIRN